MLKPFLQQSAKRGGEAKWKSGGCENQLPSYDCQNGDGGDFATGNFER